MHCFVSHLQTHILAMLVIAAGAEGPARVLSQIDRFEEAPGLVLPRLVSPGEQFDLQKLDRPVILIFGELYNQRTLQSLTELKKAYENAGLTEADLQAFLIVSHRPDAGQMTQLTEENKVKVEVLLDEDLKAFGDYGIVVLPSIVVIDRQGRVDLAISGLPLMFADMAADALLLSTGRITQQQYEALGYSARQVDAEQESVTQARRFVNLAGQLAKRGYNTLALERYREALKIDSGYLPARVGMARCLIKLNLLLDALTELRAVLKIDADNIEANLVTAQIEIVRGGDGIEEGKKRLERVMARETDHPEANYLMGMACESQGQLDHAMNYYKKAAERLLETSTK